MKIELSKRQHAHVVPHMCAYGLCMCTHVGSYIHMNWWKCMNWECTCLNTSYARMPNTRARMNISIWPTF